MKVLLIDPWGTGNTAEYLNGLIYSVGRLVDLTVYTSCDFVLENEIPCKVLKRFFKRSDSMSKGMTRTVIRGIEYIKAYIDIIKLLHKEQFDVVHINWLLMYRIDLFFLPIIKRHCRKIVYTAHNVLPHINSKKYITCLDSIYSIVDRIIVHGNNVKEEFAMYFPDNLEKIYVQYHGANLHNKVDYKESLINKQLVERIKKSTRVYLFFGQIFYNKGVDRVINIWLKNKVNSTLIVAGKINENYDELQFAIQGAEEQDNIIILDHFIDDNTLNFLINKSDIIVLPYRHASMSGVVFTAADFAKTILCTDVGSIPEYLSKGQDSFICENNEASIASCVEYIESSISSAELKKMGTYLQNNIKLKCSWENIGKKIFCEVYKGEA